MEGGSTNLRINSLLFLYFSAKWASKSPISCLVIYLEEVAEDIHSRKLGVRVGGYNWISLAVVSRRGTAKRSCDMAIH